MRLIDADALKSKIEQSGVDGTIAWYCKRVLAECLDNDAPAVDAIPVEWLRKVMMNDVMCERGSEAAAQVIELWQKEQGARQ